MYQLDTLSYQASPCLRRHTTRLGHVTVTIPIGTLTCFFLPGVIDESWTRPGHIPCQVLPENNYVLIKSYSRLILILLTGSKVILSRCGPFVLFFQEMLLKRILAHGYCQDIARILWRSCFSSSFLGMYIIYWASGT